MLYWNTTNKQSLRKHNTQNFLNRITLLKSWEASCSLDKEVQYPFPSIISPVNKKHREKNGTTIQHTIPVSATASVSSAATARPRTTMSRPRARALFASFTPLLLALLVTFVALLLATFALLLSLLALPLALLVSLFALFLALCQHFLRRFATNFALKFHKLHLDKTLANLRYM